MSKMVGDNGDNELNGGENNDDIRGKKGNDLIVGNGGEDSVFGNAGDDSIHSGAGNDSISGGRGNDHIWGEDGADRMEGGSGRDMVEGGAGNDTLMGEGGSDTLSGGSGVDTFMFKAGDADGSKDTITDFDGLLDSIDLSGLEPAGGGVLSVVGALTGVAGQVALDVDLLGNKTAILFDQNGDGHADLTVNVGGIVSALDLVL